MNAIIIELKDRTDASFWLKLARKTGNRAKSLKIEDIEDIGLAMMIKAGLNSEDVSRDSVMKALEK